jgi:outer membrane protein OmpA-like peptidoglycan-associated protein
MVNVSRSGYLFHSEKFRLKEQEVNYEKSFILSIPMLPIDTGKSTVLRNVYFDTDRSDLRKESFPELDKLVLFMKQNADLTIEISGHTDNTGDKNKNLTLSKDRAKAVTDYLVQSGIDQKRLLSVGWGELKPIAANDTEYNKQLNRRTEYRIVGTKKGMMRISSPPASTKENKTK